MRLRIFLTGGLLLIAGMGWGDVDIDSQNIGSESIYAPAKNSPFYFNTHLDVIGTAEIRKGFYKGDDVKYAEGEVEAGMMVYYCPLYMEGISLALNYSAIYLRWVDNPWFEQNHFNLFSPSIAGFSKRLNNWFWRTQITVNFDVDEWSAPFTSYDLLLWGRYSYFKNLGFHFGFLAQTGLHMDRIYPILGFDWEISRAWKLNLVYPMNISLVYSLSPPWSVALAARNFNSRFRVNKEEESRFKKTLVRYTNIGLEFSVNYAIHETTANIHAGVAIAGKYRVAKTDNSHAENYKLDPSAYIGAEMDVKF